MRGTDGTGTGRNTGFTLIELLIVIAIIIVLALLLTPPHPHRTKARQASCLSNQKQLAMAMRAYAADHLNRFPPADGWAPTISAHLKNPMLFTCPSDTAHRQSQVGGSYAMAANLSAVVLGDIARPADAPLLWDSNALGEFEKRHTDGGNVAFADGHAKWHKQALRGMGAGVIGLLPAPPDSR